MAVEVDEGSAALADRLKAAGLSVVVDGRAVLVAISDERPYDLVRDAVAELGLPLVRIEQRRHRLEDLFRDLPPVPPATVGAPPVLETPAAPTVPTPPTPPTPPGGQP